MTLGEYIIKYRSDHGLSQRQFARMTGLSNSYISMIERDCNPSSGKPITPTMAAFRSIAAAMGMSVDELFAIIDDTPVNTEDCDPDDELWELRETLRRRPEMQTLFSLTNNASAADVRQEIKIIEALIGDDGDDTGA